MLGFMLGFLIICGTLAGWSFHEGNVIQDASLTWLLVVTPGLGAWLTASLLHYRSPRRIFERQASHWPGQVLSGLMAGVISMFVAMCGILFCDRYLPDALIMAASAVIGTAPVIMLAAKLRPGHCIQCSYDVRASLQFGRCPECGLAL